MFTCTSRKLNLAQFLRFFLSYSCKRTQTPSLVQEAGPNLLAHTKKKHYWDLSWFEQMCHVSERHVYLFINQGNDFLLVSIHIFLKKWICWPFKLKKHLCFELPVVSIGTTLSKLPPKKKKKEFSPFSHSNHYNTLSLECHGCPSWMPPSTELLLWKW